MGVGSPGNGLNKMSDYFKNDESYVPEDLDLDFLINKDDDADNYFCDDFVADDTFQLDLSEQHQQQPPSFSSDFEGCNLSGSNPENFHSSKTVSDGEVLDKTGFTSNEEKLHSGFQGNQLEEAENYLHDSVFKVESGAIHHEMENDSSKCLQEIALEKDPYLDELMHISSRNSLGDKMSEKLFAEKLQQEGIEHESVDGVGEETILVLERERLQLSPISHPDDCNRENVYDPRNSLSDSKELDPQNLANVPQLSISPGPREMSNCGSQSPESKTLQKQLQDRSYSGGSERRHSLSDSCLLSPCKKYHKKRSIDIDPSVDHSPSSKRTCYSPTSQQSLKELPSSSRSCRQKHYSTGRSPLGKEVASRELQQRFTSTLRHRPAPQNYCHSHLNKQILEWPRPESPPRRKEFSSGHNRDHFNVSQSRSLRVRESHRRYSASHRSPSKHNFSHRAPQSKRHTSPYSHGTRVGKPGRCLFVAGFCFKTTEKDLERKFCKFGRVHDIRVIRDKRSGDSRGFGFLSLERDEEADEAIRALDKTEWKGRVILVEKSKTF